MSSFIPFRTDDLKEGECIGEDKFGNKYFENNKYFYGESVIQSAVAVAGDSERFWPSSGASFSQKGCVVCERERMGESERRNSITSGGRPLLRLLFYST